MSFIMIGYQYGVIMVNIRDTHKKTDLTYMVVKCCICSVYALHMQCPAYYQCITYSALLDLCLLLVILVMIQSSGNFFDIKCR